MKLFLATISIVFAGQALGQAGKYGRCYSDNNKCIVEGIYKGCEHKYPCKAPESLPISRVSSFSARSGRSIKVVRSCRIAGAASVFQRCQRSILQCLGSNCCAIRQNFLVTKQQDARLVMEWSRLLLGAWPI